MKKTTRILIFCLLLITVVSFNFQTSFGAYQAVSTSPFVSQEMSRQSDVFGVVVGVLGGAYALGYALGRAYGHASSGDQEQSSYIMLVKHDAKDFSSFDN